MSAADPQPEPTLWQLVAVRTTAERRPGRLEQVPTDADLDALEPGDLVAVMIVAGEPPNLAHWTLPLRVDDVWKPSGMIVGHPLRDLPDLALTTDDVLTVERGHVLRCARGPREHEAPEPA